MTEVTLFKNVHGNVQVVTTFGTYPFVGGRFFTTDKEVEEKLKKLAERGEHGLFIDPNEPTVDPDAATPMDALKKKIIAEHMASLRTGGNSGITESEQEGIQRSVVSTADSEINPSAQVALTPEQKIELQTGTQQQQATSQAHQALMDKLNKK